MLTDRFATFRNNNIIFIVTFGAEYEPIVLYHISITQGSRRSLINVLEFPFYAVVMSADN